MKKYFTIITILVLNFFVSTKLLFAETATIEFQSPIESQSVAQILTAFFNILVQIGAVAVTLAIVYAGFLFVAARGNPEQLNKAKTTLFWTIIGALILLGAQVIASIIQNSINQL